MSSQCDIHLTPLTWMRWLCFDNEPQRSVLSLYSIKNEKSILETISNPL